MTEELTPTERPKRLTLSQIVERLLVRSSDRSAVSLTRNASGETQIDVTVRTDDGETVEDAERRAQEVYDRLHEKYPPRNGHEDADVTLTRNAKGETQIVVGLKTSAAGIVTLADAEKIARQVYDGIRMKYPMADGYSAKPGSVA